jgi:hypothetical protein
LDIPKPSGYRPAVSAHTPHDAPPLQPLGLSADIDFKALGRLTSRRSRFDCFDNSLTQVT